MYQKIDHLGIVVFDIATSLAWYAHNLGWELLHEEFISEVGANVAYLLPKPKDFTHGLTALQLVQPIEPSAVLDHLTLHGEGMHHICFEVHDISDAVGELGEDPERIFKGGRNQRACFLAGSPNGVLVELTERVLAPVDLELP